MKKVAVAGPGGEVLAPFGGPNVLIWGKPKMIQVVRLCKSKSLPLRVRQTFVGMNIETIFNSKQIGDAFTDEVPQGSLLAYADEIIGALRQAGKEEVAEDLKRIAPNKFDLVVFGPGTFVERKEEGNGFSRM